MYNSVWISVAHRFLVSPYFFLVYGLCVMSCPDTAHICFVPPLDVLQEYSNKFGFFVASVIKPLILCVVPSVAWGEDGIDELHVVGYVYRELLVCTANFTYIYATSLSTLYSLCLLYTTYTTY